MTTIHPAPHPLAGQTIRVSFAKAPHAHLPDPAGEYDFVVEDYWDRLTGKSWMFSDGNPAALVYAMRTGMAPDPTAIPLFDDEVLYGKIGNLGHLVHVCELLEDTPVQPAEAAEHEVVS